MATTLCVFDAFGTLFDIGSAVARHGREIGPCADRLAELWRTKQLEATWVRTLMGRYRDFQAVTEDALEVAAAMIGGLPEDLKARLIEAHATLDAFPDVAPTLTALRDRGVRTAILSNGTPANLNALVRSAGLENSFDAVLSVDTVRSFKPDPRAYALVGAHFGTAPQETFFVSSNRWDVAGASAFGFRAVWLNRKARPDEYPDAPPARLVVGLHESLVD